MRKQVVSTKYCQAVTQWRSGGGVSFPDGIAVLVVRIAAEVKGACILTAAKLLTITSYRKK